MINEIAGKISNDLVKIRRELHKIPELAFEEYKTCEFIENELKKLNIKYEKPIKTGIVATLKGKKGTGKTLLIRADIDALPILEENDLPYKSQNIGKMHACGHDAHITSLLGVCKILKEINYDFYGNIKVVFQPAEESDGGALPIIETGIMNAEPKVDGAVALHVLPTYKVGEIVYKDGSMMASPDDFKIILKGKGGHGAMPEFCKNPIYPGGVLVSRLKNIVSENFSDPSECVLSVCTINAGTFYNIIPDTVEITGTARSLTNEVREKIENLIEEYTKKVADEFDLEYEYRFNKQYPPVINDVKMNEILVKSAKDIKEIKKIIKLEKAFMTGDDFSYFSNAVPGTYFMLGAGNDKINVPLHSTNFEIDEKCLHLGAAILTQFALNYLNK